MADANGAILPHWSLASILPALKDFNIPSDPFDPNGHWDRRYIIWMIDPANPALADQLLHPPVEYAGSNMGTLRVKRTNTDSKRVRFDIERESTRLGQGNGHHRTISTQATVVARNDRLSTPLSWVVEDTLFNPDKPENIITKIGISAEVEGNTLVLSGGASNQIRLSPLWTLDFMLFDALQRFAPSDDEPINFDMFEDFDMPRPDQRLSPCGSVSASIGGSQICLYGYRQLGRGVLPRHYWLDGHRRLLFAIAGHVAYIAI
ncbi:MAG: hypothetical protein K9M54_06955 [Kiritimatiellales bacterium]|nr:hypothetical protein [Kiritimatiellales bacterium]